MIPVTSGHFVSSTIQYFMPQPSSTYYSRLYRDFRGIEPGAYREVVHFYEVHEEAIRRAGFEEYFDMMVAYTHALFETGAYRKHLLMADVAIEASMSQEVDMASGKVIFEHMLFRKAASQYNLSEYTQAEHLLRQLIRINPDHAEAAPFLKKCLLHQRPEWLQQARAASIFLFLLAALITCIELLLVRPFYAMHVNLVENSRNTTFAMGLFVLLGAELLHRWRTKQRMEG